MTGTSSNYSFLRQFSSNFEQRSGKGYEEMEQAGFGLGMYDHVMNIRKRVMVVVDESSRSKHAMMWALTHVTHKGDLLTLLHVVPAAHSSSTTANNSMSASLASLCKACRPEVEVEVIVVEGSKFGTVMSQVKKLEVSVLVLGQKKPSNSSLIINCCLVGKRSRSSEEFVEKCINRMDCLTIGVRKQSMSVGGYLISTRWHKNFWLLA